MSLTIDPALIGPVDVAVIGFADHAFRPELAAALREIVEARTVRIIDLAFVRKAADGTTAVAEIPDSEVAAAFSALHNEQNDLLSDEDLQGIAEELEPATAALVIVWENSWAANAQQQAADQAAAETRAQQAAAAPPAVADPGADQDVLAKIRELGELKQQGLLTGEEFAALKAKLIATA